LDKIIAKNIVNEEYLLQILADGDTDELLEATGHIAKAKGRSQT